MKVAFISLGCPKNQTDLEYLIGELAHKNHDIVTETADADVVVINTCGFIEPAVNEAIDTILETAEELKPEQKLVVSGCMVERYRKEFGEEFPEVDFYTGVGSLGEIVDWLDGKKANRASVLGSNRILANAPYFAYLKVADGCNNACSYCTIPSIRGHLKSRPMEDILDEAERLVASNVKEIVLISQDNTKFGMDTAGRPLLSELIGELDAMDGDFFVRVMYLNPDGVTDELIEAVSASKRCLPYFEVPVQSGSDAVLSGMRRKYSASDAEAVFARIRERVPDAFIRTTLITGFPGETDEDAAASEAFIERVRPDFAGFFPYSPEDGTPAAALETQVPKKVVTARLGRLQKLQKKITLDRLKQEKKGTIRMFAEKAHDDFEFMVEGRALFQAPEVDGKAIVTDGVADRGAGPYRAKITRIVYPDIYCTIMNDDNEA